jgi:hypothetical protein
MTIQTYIPIKIIKLTFLKTFSSGFSFLEPVKSILIRRLSISRCSLDNLDDVVAIAIKAEFHTTSLDFSVAGKELNDREKARLEELYIASRSGKYKNFFVRKLQMFVIS